MTLYLSIRTWLREWAPVIALISITYLTSGIILWAGASTGEIFAVVGVATAALLGFWALWELAGRALVQDDSGTLDWEVDPAAVELRELGGQSRSVRVPYSELTRVLVETTSGGPFVEDFFYILETPDSTLRIPLEVACAEGLADHLFELPGFDHSAVIEASCCVEDRVWVAWTRDS